MEYSEVLEGMIAIGHAKKIKEYCKDKKECKRCIFWNGICTINTFLPSDWDFRKEVEEKGHE